MLSKKKGQKLRDDLEKLRLGGSLAYRLTNVSQRMSAYNSASVLGIRLKIRPPAFGNGLEVTRIK